MFYPEEDNVVCRNETTNIGLIIKKKRMTLFVGTVQMAKMLFVGTVPMAEMLFVGTILMTEMLHVHRYQGKIVI